jgi:hypothetical protein
MFNITSQLRLCGENVTDEAMLEKTFSPFHASNLLLQQQYRARQFKKYSELISCLMVAEQNELLLKNHNSRPTGSASINEANVASYNDHKNGHGKKNYGRGHGKGSGKGRGKQYFQSRGNKFHKKWNNNRDTTQKKGKNVVDNGHTHNRDQPCHISGLKGHWAHVCRTPKHFVDLYHASIKGKAKKLKQTSLLEMAHQIWMFLIFLLIQIQILIFYYESNMLFIYYPNS